MFAAARLCPAAFSSFVFGDFSRDFRHAPLPLRRRTAFTDSPSAKYPVRLQRRSFARTWARGTGMRRGIRTDADAAHFREVIRIAAPPSRLYGIANASGTLQRGRNPRRRLYGNYVAVHSVTSRFLCGLRTFRPVFLLLSPRLFPPVFPSPVSPAYVVPLLPPSAVLFFSAPLLASCPEGFCSPLFSDVTHSERILLIFRIFSVAAIGLIGVLPPEKTYHARVRAIAAALNAAAAFSSSEAKPALFLSPPQKKAATEKRDACKKITLSRSLRPFAAPPPHLCPDGSRPRNMKQPLKLRTRLPSLPILHHPSAKRCADKFFSLAKEPFFKKLFLFLAARPFPKTICNRLFSRFRRTFSFFFDLNVFLGGEHYFFSQFFYLSFFYLPLPPRPPFSACVQRKNSVPEPSFCFIPGFAISARGNFLPSPSASPQIRHIFHDNKQKFSILRPEKCAHLLYPKLLIASPRWSPPPDRTVASHPLARRAQIFFLNAPTFLTCAVYALRVPLQTFRRQRPIHGRSAPSRFPVILPPFTADKDRPYRTRPPKGICFSEFFSYRPFIFARKGRPVPVLTFAAPSPHGKSPLRSDTPSI